MKDSPTVKANSSLLHSTSFREQSLLHRALRLLPLRAFCVPGTNSQRYGVCTQDRKEVILWRGLSPLPGN